MNKEERVVIDLESWKKWKVQREQELKHRQRGNVYAFPVIRKEVRNCPKCDEPIVGKRCRNCGFPLAADQISIDSFLKSEE